MEIVTVIPPFLAVLNTSAAAFIAAGYVFVRKGNRRRHMQCMISALAISAVFMVCYLYYHAQVGNIPFAGQGAIRPIYFSILITHVLLAAILFPLALTTAGLALKGKTNQHKKIARWTVPIWLYVSVTGVVVYLLAFHFFTA